MYFSQLLFLFNYVSITFQVMRPQHGVEFSIKELNATSWNVGETPNVSILVMTRFFDLAFTCFCSCHVQFCDPGETKTSVVSYVLSLYSYVSLVHVLG